VDERNRPLLIVVAILAISVLLTGGLAIYLTVARAGGAVERGAVEVAGTAAVAVASSIREGYSTGLYVVTLQTGELTTVVRDEGWLGWPAWSPDGQRLLFTMGPLRQRTGTELPYANLWTYELASGTLEQLTVREGFAGLGTWSP